MTEERFIFEEFLRSRNLKLTSARRTVLKAFLNTEGHLSADEIFLAARRLDPKIGQATVFRTIKLIAEAGLARDACQDDGPRRYEHAYRHSHHDHLLCVQCGKIIEFFDEQIEEAQEAIFERYGFTPSGHRMELHGLCKECAPKARAEETT